MEQEIPHLKFYSSENSTTGYSSTIEHIILDGETVLCNAKAKGHPQGDADWDAIHSPRFHRLCSRCYKTAVLLLRPRAKFWYLDPFHGEPKEFYSLPVARKNVKNEHGSCAIWQTGPGEINKIVDISYGRNILP